MLFDALERTVRSYPPTMQAVYGGVPGTSFFPGGDGLFKGESMDSPPWPVGKILVIGNDWGTVRQHSRTILTEVNGPTWGPLTMLMRGSLADRSLSLTDCFYSNAYMGLRVSGSSLGKSPAQKDPYFTEECRRFLEIQISVLQPKLILTLGTWSAEFISTLAPKLESWRQRRHPTWAHIDNGGILHEDVIFDAIPGLGLTVCALTHPFMAAQNDKHRDRSTYSDEPTLLNAALSAAGFSLQNRY